MVGELRNDDAKVVDAVAAGETFVATRDGVPMAELRPIERPRRKFVAREELVALGAAGPHVDLADFRADRRRSGYRAGAEELGGASRARCSTTATTLPAMNRAVRIGEPVRVTSVTSTAPREFVISTRLPARLALISKRSTPVPTSTSTST